MSRGKASESVGTLGHALLGLLADEPMTGYDLARTFDLSLGNVWSAKHGQIYPELARLEAIGLIAQVGSGARGSKTYAPTPAGLSQLRQWLARSDVPRASRNESALQLFFLWLLAPDERIAALRNEEAYHRARLERYREITTMFPADPDAATRWSRITLEMGLRFEEMMADWSRWAAERVAEKP